MMKTRSNVGAMLDRELEQLRGQVDEMRAREAQLTEAVQQAHRQRQEIQEAHPKTHLLLQRVHDLEKKNGELSTIVVEQEAKLDLLREVLDGKVSAKDFS